MTRLTKLVAVSALTLWAGSAMAKDMTQDFKVDGWSCNGCADKTTTALKKVNGVKDAKANLKETTLTVTFDDEVIKPDAVAEAVKKVGYGCSIKEDKKS